MGSFRLTIGALTGLLLLTVGPAWAQDDQQPQPQDETDKIGVHHTKDKDGDEAVVYSTGKPKRGRHKRQADQDRENSWRMLNNVLIDTRRQSR